MKKIITLLTGILLLNGCAESMALLGPASTALSKGNVAQSAVSSALSFGVKKQTGMSPTEHALAYVKEHNPEKKKDVTAVINSLFLDKEKCISFIDATKSEACAAIKKNIIETKKKIVQKSKIKFLDITP